jgi:hypothetical protein
MLLITYRVKSPSQLDMNIVILVYLPDREEDKEKHWVIPLSVKRVKSHQSGPEVGLLQFEQIAKHTVNKIQ